MRISIRRPTAGTTWVVVCNDYRAQVFEWVKPAGPLLQLQVLVHSLGRCRSPDLPHNVEQQIFAREVAGFLSSRAKRGEFVDLVLVAPALFLSLLGDLLSDLPQAMVVTTMNRDMTAAKPHELMIALEEILPSSSS